MIEKILFSAVSFLSAFLFFSLQPVMTKWIQPFLGGSAQVWTTAMLFFQTLLLLGYLLAHYLTRASSPIQRTLIHLLLMLLALFSLPLELLPVTSPEGTQSPVLWLLKEFGRRIALPVLVLAATSPLLQKIYASGKGQNRSPYFLYIWSNLASFAALFSYLFWIEPRLRLADQGWYWTVGYGLFTLLMAVAVFLSRDRVLTVIAPASSVSTESGNAGWAERLHWIALAWIPASLLYGVTSIMTLDLASFPLLWVMPLAFYLLSYIIAFSECCKQGLQFLRKTTWLLLILSGLWLSMKSGQIVYVASGLWILYFLIATVFHYELACRKPSPGRLTEFYLCIAVSGCLGGVFNVLLAPLIFPLAQEYFVVLLFSWAVLGGGLWFQKSTYAWENWIFPVCLSLAMGMVYQVFSGRVDFLRIEHFKLGNLIFIFLPALAAVFFRRCLLGFFLLLALIYFPFKFKILEWSAPLYAERSYYGIHRVRQHLASGFIEYIQGSTLHGFQSHTPELRSKPLGYYHEEGPVGEVLRAVKYQDYQRVGVVGLGIGSLAAWSLPEQHWTFYEIDPVVKKIAEDTRFFSYLKEAKGKVDVKLGDGRLSIAQEPAASFDLLILDAFSSDWVPVHLLTREAFQIYMEKLREKGILMVHVSSRYLHLDHVIGSLAHDLGLACWFRVDAGDELSARTPSNWLVLARNEADLAALAQDGDWLKGFALDDPRYVWRDDYSNIPLILEGFPGAKRRVLPKPAPAAK